MTRQALFLRVLLSLLLLVSQQMATSHAMSHWGAALSGGQAQAHSGGDAKDLSSAFAQDPTCDQCLAFAQLAGPLGSHPRGFAAVDLVDVVIGNGTHQPACARTVCAFHSRAPPQV